MPNPKESQIIFDFSIILLYFQVTFDELAPYGKARPDSFGSGRRREHRLRFTWVFIVKDGAISRSYASDFPIEELK